jgi:hypothetical protein
VVCVVVVWVVELVSGVAGCWLGEVDDGDVCELVSDVVDCGELPGEVCATAQTADNNRIAVIKDIFLIYVPPGLFGLRDSGLEKSGSSAKDLDRLFTRGFASFAFRTKRNESCRILRREITCLWQRIPSSKELSVFPARPSLYRFRDSQLLWNIVTGGIFSKHVSRHRISAGA